MKITKLAIENRVTTYLLATLLLVFGYISYVKSEKAEDPGFTIKVALITTNWPGATANQMAELVSKRMADEIQSMDSLDYVTSKNIDGQSNVYVNIKAQYKDMQPVWEELRNRVNTFVVPQLPPGVQTPIINTYFGDVYGTLITVSGSGYSYAELYRMSEKLKEDLLFYVPEIGQVDIGGVQNETIYINIDNNKLSSSGITLQNLTNSLSSLNVIVQSGNVVDNNSRILLIPTGNFTNLEQIENTVITNDDGTQSIYLREIATVEKGYQDPSTYMVFYNGEPSITLAVALGAGQDILKMGKGIQDLMKEFKDQLPVGLDVGTIYYQPSLVDDKIVAFVVNLVQAIATIVAVMFIFLGLRSGLIVAALTPTSIAFTLMAMYYMGYGINQITLAGLIIALGMLVDNAVVMSENIMVLIQKGKSRMDACMESSRSLAIPLLVSSLTTVTAFSPIILNNQNMGQYVGPLAVVVFLALISSWLINQTIIPLLCYDFIQVKEKDEQNFNNKAYVFYRESLIKMLKYKKMSVGVVLASFILGLWLFRFIPSTFMPDSTDPIMSTSIRLPKGTNIEVTTAVTQDLSNFIQENFATGSQVPLNPSIYDYMTTGGTIKKYEKPGVLSWASFVGGGAPKYSTGYTPEARLTEYSYTMYNLTDYKLIGKISNEVDKYMENKYPDIDIVTKGVASGVTLEKDLGYQFISNDVVLLKRVAEEVKEKIKSMEGTRAISDNWGNDVPRIYIEIDQVKAKNAGFTSKDIGESLQFALQGYPATLFRDFKAPPKSTAIPILLKGTNSYKDNITGLEGLEIINPANGQSVPLKQIANIKVEYSQGFIFTRHLSYTIEVDAAVDPGYTAANLNKLIQPWIDEKLKEWGPSVKYELAGIEQTSSENKEALFAQVPTALLIMIILVIGQFNSIRKGFAIILAIPLSILGIAIGLIVTKTQLGFMAIVGIVALAGVVLNHAIILVDKMTVEKENGRNDQDSVVFGCQERLRPIFLTVATTLVGLLPLYLFGGPLFQPLAVVLIFGLMMDTVLALGIVPVFYAIFFKIDFKDYEYDPDKLNEDNKESWD
ncbi:efflux RND transporter permease subunit [Cetobacterium sp. 2A]|uniref:efflux RND transporter permease subunit n=1 Tax=Cetobacterium sp. 2A TaxID=2754723 RepID=UPI00163C4CEF|nr:efflux RND transporter permease subunit [Cetobacterium sp. 2A]MBC2856301.1 efflux RND transporter permease subunit [Cetobacterium sp. 2A]